MFNESQLKRLQLARLLTIIVNFLVLIITIHHLGLMYTIPKEDLRITTNLVSMIGFVLSLNLFHVSETYRDKIKELSKWDTNL